MAVSCETAASILARDRMMPGRARKLEAALASLNIAHDVKEYPDAGHSFMNRINAGPLFAPLLHLTGFDYHHPSAEDAWRRIFIFFDDHLGTGQGGGPD